MHSVFAVHAVVSDRDNKKSIMFNKCRWQHKFQHVGCFQAIHFLYSYESGNVLCAHGKGTDINATSVSLLPRC